MPVSPRSRRLLPIAFLLAVLLLASVVLVLVSRVQVAAPGAVTTGGTVDVRWPRTGQAAVSVDDHEDILQPGSQRPVPIASLTKIMTALVVLDRSRLAAGDDGPTVTITADDVADTARRQARSESVVALSPGEHLSERQALLALLLPSAGNLAHVLATRTAGSEHAFVALMNVRAQRLGMSDTTYADVSGFDSATRSTARDQTVLARAAMRVASFAELVAQPSVTLPTAGVVTTTDRLLGHRGFVGVKTGSTTPAGGCFVFAVRRETDGHPRLVVGAVLGQRGPAPLPAAFDASEQLVDSVTDPVPSGATTVAAAPPGSRRTPGRRGVVRPLPPP